MDALSPLLLLNLLDNLQSAIMIQAEDSNIRYANKLFFEMFRSNLPAEGITGKTILEKTELIKPLFREPEKFSARVKEILEKKEPVKNELLYMANGCIIERDFIPGLKLEESYGGNVWLFRDITERKRL